MARLFGKEFHELSNTWFFKSSLIDLQKGDLHLKKYLDEQENLILIFEAAAHKKLYFSVKIEIVYDRINHEIIHHHCSVCGEKPCRHYLSVIDYCYHYLTEDVAEQQIIQTYQAKILDYNEYWQRIVLNAKIEIGDIFNKTTDKVRFFLKSYQPLEVRLIAILAAGKEFKEEDTPLIPRAEKQAKSLSEAEIKLFALLQNYKCSFSRKGIFFTVYKRNFIRFLPLLRELRKKVFIRETGDLLEFPDEDFRLTFQINRNGENYLLETSVTDKISAVFVGRTTYIFQKNKVSPLNLPFKKEVAEAIFNKGYPLRKEDLVYFSSIVARQLGLIKCYLDFAEDIEIPPVFSNTPLITFNLFKENDKIIMEGFLDYGEENLIPMSVIRYPTELVRYDFDDKVCWFYIPPQTKYQIMEFYQKLPQADFDKLEDKSELIFAGEENIENLKKVIFEHADSSWDIKLSEELKNEFIYKVVLQPTIKTRSSQNIDWFEYEVEYKFKDVSFTHEELKKFFKSRREFLKLEDGRLLFFENKTAFEEVEKLLKKSNKLPSDAYKLSIYNLPYVYQLGTVNKGIRIFGDNFLEEMFGAILNRKLPARAALPNFLKPVMRSYQKLGFQWLKMLQYYNLAGILADDMGLGKTVQAISVLSTLPQDSKSLVICPKTLLFNWAAEIRKFNPALSHQIYEGNQKERKKILETLNVNVLLASYSIIQNDIDELSKINFSYVILDEAQHIKNAYALRTKAVKKLDAHYKLALSGTPIENNPLELWSIFDFLMPGYLPSQRTFKNEYSNISSNRESQDKLKKLVAPFILRRKKNEVLIELPDKQIQHTFCRLTPFQEKMYLQVLEKVKHGLRREDAANGKEYFHILAALMRLRQICNHPSLVDENIKPDFSLSGKMELLEEIIVDAVENGKKILVFSQFVQMLQILKKMVSRLKIPFEYLDGSTRNREKHIDNFNNNNKIKIFLISLKTGGFGLNLTAADTVIIVDPWWNPMGENQAIDRAHRIGQTKKVMVYKMITQGTIEEKILNLQRNKEAVFKNVIDNGQYLMKSMNKKELRKLLEY